MVRVRVNTKYFVRCESCGHVEDLIARTPQERKSMTKKFPPIQPLKARTNVVPLRRKA